MSGAEGGLAPRVTPVSAFGDVLPASIAAVSRGGIAASQRALEPGLRRLHRLLLQAFLAHGAPPGPQEIAAMAAELGLDPAAGLSALAAADLVHADAAGRITVAYPLSGVASPHRVQATGFPPVAAMCAIDALGVLLMTACDGVIHSADPTTGEAIAIERADGRWQRRPAGVTVVLAADRECSGPISEACPLTAYHASGEQAAAALAAAGPGVSGRVLTWLEALAVAEHEFGGLLTGDN